MKENKRALVRDIIRSLDTRELKSIERELTGSEEGEGAGGGRGQKDNLRLVRNIVNRVNAGQEVREVIRDTVYNVIRPPRPGAPGGTEGLERKRNEIREILNGIEKRLAGRNLEEASALFASMLDMLGQVCVQKTDGVVAAKIRLNQLFSVDEIRLAPRPEFKNEVTLIFTPEEIEAMRNGMPEMGGDDPLRPFFAAVLDQAYDVVQYNEMTGRLLLVMSRYFIGELEARGYSDHNLVKDFRARQQRAELLIPKAVEELAEAEAVIGAHLRQRPILEELPRYLRLLIKVKLGMIPDSYAPQLIRMVCAKSGEYARARSAVAFDFNRIPLLRHGIHTRHKMVLNLHKDVLNLSYGLREREFYAIKEDLRRMVEDMEASSEAADPSSPDYKDYLRKKADAQARLELSRRQLDVVRCQQDLVEAQSGLIAGALERYRQNRADRERLEEQLRNRPAKKISIIAPRPETQREASRMHMARRARAV